MGPQMDQYRVEQSRRVVAGSLQAFMRRDKTMIYMRVLDLPVNCVLGTTFNTLILSPMP